MLVYILLKTTNTTDPTEPCIHHTCTYMHIICTYRIVCRLIVETKMKINRSREDITQNADEGHENVVGVKIYHETEVKKVIKGTT